MLLVRVSLSERYIKKDTAAIHVVVLLPEGVVLEFD